MSTATFRFAFSVSALNIGREMIGSVDPVHYRGKQCRIAYIDDMLNQFATQSDEQRLTASSFRIEVDTPSELVLGDFRVGDSTTDTGAIALAQFTEAAQIAEELAQRYVDRLRTRLSQFWIASTVSRSRMIDFAEVRIDGSSWVRANFGYGPIRLRASAHIPLVRDNNQSALLWVADGNSIEPAEALLADAHHLNSQSNPDGRQLVLMSAIACEVKIKDTLLDLATGEQKPLIELLINNPRDFSKAAASLFDQPLEVVSGRSLKTDDRDLYKDVNKLFTDRNKVAHRGDFVDSIESPSRYVFTAQRAFYYLNSIRETTSN